jgi:uncharacterized glyoxalase superfamily protein PhnB
MSNVTQIILTLHVPSVEQTAAWYEQILGWQGHYDTFNRAGECLFGSVALQRDPWVGFNLARSDATATGPCDHCASWIYIDNVDAVYARVMEQGWPVESEVEDKFWGDRVFKLRDVNGNALVIAQPVETLSLDEIRERHKRLQGDDPGA